MIWTGARNPEWAHCFSKNGVMTLAKWRMSLRLDQLKLPQSKMRVPSLPSLPINNSLPSANPWSSLVYFTSSASLNSIPLSFAPSLAPCCCSLFSYSVMSDYLWPHGLQHARLPCPSLSPRVHSNSCPLSQWCHPTISFSVAPFSFCLQSFPASAFCPKSQLFAPSGQSIGASTSASVLPMNIQGWWIFVGRTDARPILSLSWINAATSQLPRPHHLDLCYLLPQSPHLYPAITDWPSALLLKLRLLIAFIIKTGPAWWRDGLVHSHWTSKSPRTLEWTDTLNQLPEWSPTLKSHQVPQSHTQSRVSQESVLTISPVGDSSGFLLTLSSYWNGHTSSHHRAFAHAVSSS